MRRLPLFVRPEAEQDLLEAHAWYQRSRPGLGEEFLAVVQNGLKQIERSPELFAADRFGVRQACMERFPYIIFFCEINDRLEIIGVLHGHRNPAVWRRRVRE